MLCHELKKQGHDAKAIMRQSHCPSRVCNYYDADIRDINSHNFLEWALVEARKQPDVIHYHSGFEQIPELRKLAARAKIIIHYHGTDLTMSDKKKRINCESYADKILVSTPDLLEHCSTAEWLPNPVDTDHFKPDNNPFKDSRPMTISSRYIRMDLIKGFPDLQVVDREKNPRIYAEMPALLNKYQTYVDIKPYEWRQTPKAEFSATGLQALACGLKVILSDNITYEGLPEKHRIENVTKRLLEIYAT